MTITMEAHAVVYMECVPLMACDLVLVLHHGLVYFYNFFNADLLNTINLLFVKKKRLDC